MEEGQRIRHLAVERELGRGAFGVVWRARDTLLDRPVALKAILEPGEGIAPDVRETILCEARLVGNLSCPHVVTLYGVHDDPEHGILLEMEYLSGGTLEDRLAEARSIDPEEAGIVFRGLLLALEAAAEARVVHGDVKPANVLFDAAGTPKLADFGISRTLAGDKGSILLHGEIAGSPLLMAPEVISGDRTGPAADLWSACVVLYVMLSGRYPFRGDTFPALMSRVVMDDPEPLPESVPPYLREIVTAGLAKDPADRPSSATELLDLLRTGMAAEGAPPPPAPNFTSPGDMFSGRESELEELDRLLADPNARLVTIMGPPGAGKTWLMLEAAMRARAGFPGGVVLAGADAGTPGELLGRAPSAVRHPTLVLLDGVEDDIAAAASLVSRWLRAAAPVRFLVASEMALSVLGERRLELSPPNELEPDEKLRASWERSLARLDDWERAALLAIAGMDMPFRLWEAEEAIDLSGFEDAPLAMDAVQSLRDRSLLRAVDSGDEPLFDMMPAYRKLLLE